VSRAKGGASRFPGISFYLFILFFSHSPIKYPFGRPLGRLLVVVEVVEVVVVALAGQVVVAFDDFGRRGPKTLRLHYTHSTAGQRPHCTPFSNWLCKLN
jgi:hypothetical protein